MDDPSYLIVDEEGDPIDCEEGIFTFICETISVPVGDEEKVITIPVLRKNGSDGRVSCQYKMEGLSATPGYDYVDEEGMLDFKDGVTAAEIELTILPKQRGAINDVLQIIIEEAAGEAIFNPNTDGGEDSCLLTITIVNELNDGKMTFNVALFNLFDRLLNVGEMWLGTVTWKVFYAVAAPPPVYLGGWLCFTIALCQIGVLTAAIGDLAELFGCSANIPDSITAITFVALGTSLPDLFASKTAATEDEYADASIVNVTGSNSVNVFLGIGLPWFAASVYWSIVGQNDEWQKKYPQHVATEPNGAFIVTSGDLGFSVIIFTLAAIVCLCLIRGRRVLYGGELGGPSDPKACSSFLMVMLWLTYIVLSIWKTIDSNSDAASMQVIVIAVCIPVLSLCMVIFLILLQILKISREYIGEEGFWGIFVASLVIGMRILFFIMFQAGS